MLKGEYHHSLDDKGRVFIPSKLRSFLGETFVLTRGLDGCLSIYPQDEWQIIVEKARGLKLTDPKARLFKRVIFSRAVDCNVDKQGRIAIPQNLREHAAIDRDVAIVGVGERLEVWSEERWSGYQSEISDDYIAEQLEGLDF
ncbi:MAG: division/cell wall cluster transcriptional repressor MraZ [bacterium]|nr:division/cell wall cluster transcriptional repressor MraZ [bacterium]MDD3806068.1 division/cell wall cluster transcriptional repressor MraZ [bacterium]MDD4152491.1 division/cell wall cluster transcriptional repressor MraZ [bacterium]MDD4559106.1 division/cell wall cluster transcriptional repressor MraZ [bacterium]